MVVWLREGKRPGNYWLSPPQHTLCGFLTAFNLTLLQAIALLDTLDKDVNTFVMRVREWYSWHFPELVKVCPEAT